MRARAAVTGTQVLGQLNWTRDADVTAGKLTGHFELYVANDGVLTKSVIVDRSGRLGVGSTAPSISGTGKFHHSGDTCRIVDAANAPANSAAVGNLGELRLSGGYLYYHDGTNWRRAAGSTF